MGDDVQRDLGRMEAQIAALAAQSDAMSAAVKSLAEKCDEIGDLLAQAKGSWRTIMAIAGVSSAATGFIVKFFPLGGSHN